MSFWSKVDRWVTGASAVLAGSALVIMMGAVAMNVLGRSFFAYPLYGMIEIVSLAGVLLISFSIGLTERSRSHITIRILTSRLSQRIQHLLTLAACFLSAAMMAAVAWGGLLMAVEDARTPGATTYVLHLNKGPFRFLWVLGCVVLLVFLIRHLCESLGQIRRK